MIFRDLKALGFFVGLRIIKQTGDVFLGSVIIAALANNMQDKFIDLMHARKESDIRNLKCHQSRMARPDVQRTIESTC